MFFFSFITGTCRSRGTDARIWGGGVPSSCSSHKDTGMSGVSRVHGNHRGCCVVHTIWCCIHSGREPTATSLYSSAPQRCNIRSEHTVVYHIPSCSQFIKLMSLPPNWCISLIHLWLAVLFWDRAAFITDICSAGTACEVKHGILKMTIRVGKLESNAQPGVLARLSGVK